MVSNSTKGEENRYIVRKVSIADTLRNLPTGRPVMFDCREAGPLNSAYSAATRLRNAGEGEWKIDPNDNGAHYIITRLA